MCTDGNEDEEEVEDLNAASSVTVHVWADAVRKRVYEIGSDSEVGTVKRFRRPYGTRLFPPGVYPALETPGYFPQSSGTGLACTFRNAWLSGTVLSYDPDWPSSSFQDEVS